MTESQKDTIDHIAKVQRNLLHVICMLADRSREHDASKLEEPELSGYESLRIRLADVEYGTDEYKAALQECRDTIAHHYAHNRHHPEHWQLGITDMSILDIIEMLADWKAAGERTKNGNLGHSIQVNVSRFSISEQLHAILINTAKELGWL
jgi:hypothetical protein